MLELLTQRKWHSVILCTEICPEGTFPFGLPHTEVWGDRGCGVSQSRRGTRMLQGKGLARRESESLE